MYRLRREMHSSYADLSASCRQTVQIPLMLIDSTLLDAPAPLPLSALLQIALVLALLSGWLGYRFGRHQARQAPQKATVPPPFPWHTLTPQQAAVKLQCDPDNGLSLEEASERRSKYGSNRFAENRARPVWHLLLSQFKSLLILVLLVAAALAAAIGDLTDGIIILVVITINALLGFYQEFQAERSLSALKKMLALQAKVRRDGDVLLIDAEQLVPGDIVILEAGDKIPADGRILNEANLKSDESSLTGESLPVGKQTQALPQTDLPLAERNNMLYMNNAISRGRAEMLVTSTGMDTEIGRLAALLSAEQDGDTPLQKQLDSLGKRLAFIALAVVIVLFSAALWRGEPLLETAVTAIALAVAAIPEGLPAVVTVTLALGMHRMAKQQAIVKRLAAVETLGCTSVICTDKTGTLTVNQMTVRAAHFRGQDLRITGEGYSIRGEILDGSGKPYATAEKLLLPLILCNNSQIRDQEIIGDPMEAALVVLAGKGGITQTEANRQWPRIAELPFDAANKFMATFHRRDDDRIWVCIKGAPEVVIALCGQALADEGNTVAMDSQQWLQKNREMAATGLRVLAVAERELPYAEFLAHEDLFCHIGQLTLIGLIGLIDPPRIEAGSAIRLSQRAGITVKMITGDQAITAKAIAHELGITGEVLEGKELAVLDDDELAVRIADTNIFARTAPEQKVRIVHALKVSGHIVAMTGDGVNDAPALKKADIGIAMGITGTDVAKEAATMVLTDDNFATIVKAIAEGRGIYENMIKFVRFQLSTNIGAILTVASAPLLGLPVPFTAVQLLWINIIMDGPPAMSLGVDPCRQDAMQEAPRSSEARILSWRRLGNLFTYGLTMAVGTLGVLAYDLGNGNPDHAKTLAFTTFVLFQVFNVFNARAENHSSLNQHFFANRILWLALLGVVSLQILAIHWPTAQALFHTTELNRDDWLLATGVAASVLVLEELRKLLHWLFLRINRNHRYEY